MRAAHRFRHRSNCLSALTNCRPWLREWQEQRPQPIERPNLGLIYSPAVVTREDAAFALRSCAFHAIKHVPGQSSEAGSDVQKRVSALGGEHLRKPSEPICSYYSVIFPCHRVIWRIIQCVSSSAPEFRCLNGFLSERSRQLAGSASGFLRAERRQLSNKVWRYGNF